MKRRSFLQFVAAASAASVAPEKLSAFSPSPSWTGRNVFAAEQMAPASIIQSLRNDYLEVALYSDATAEIKDRKHGGTWRMGPVALQDDSPIEQGAVWVRTPLARVPGAKIVTRCPRRARASASW